MTLNIPTTFDDLPTHLQLFVLSFVKAYKINRNVSKVSSHWHNLCKDPSIWRRLEIDGKLRTRTEIVRVFNRNFFVADVIFNSMSDFSWIDSIEKHPKVRQIKFKYCQLGRSVLTKLAEKFPRVAKISFTPCQHVDVDAISEITEWHDSVKSIQIINTMDDGIPTFVSLIVEKLKNLEELDISNCRPIKNDDFQRLMLKRGQNFKSLSLNCCLLTDVDYALLTRQCVNLTHLTLYTEIFTSDYGLLISDYGLLMLQNLASLEYLEIFKNRKLFSKHFSALFETARFDNLKELVLFDCKGLDNTTLVPLIKSCPNLTDLTINKSNGISNYGLSFLPSICSNLERLILRYVDQVTEVGLRRAVNLLPKMRYCVSQFCPLVRNGRRCVITDKRTKSMLHKKCSCVESDVE